MKLFLKAIGESKLFVLHDEDGNQLPGQVSTKVISSVGEVRKIEVVFNAFDSEDSVQICDDK